MLAVEKNQCCGCGACVQSCHFHAISLEEDEEGFLYPKINEELCKKCNLCEKICAFSQGLYQENEFEEPLAYAVKHKDMEIRMNSRSGGCFTALSDWILDRNGIVYGCGYDEKFQAVHKRAETKEERDEFRGSKYVQSRMESVFMAIKEDLNDGKEVLFSGTSCQVASLKKYLENIDQSKLYLIDIVCHGVPSPKVWKDYLTFMGHRFHGKITGVNFRNKKKYGWKKHIETIEVNKIKHNSRIYTKLFYSHFILRPSCYVCPYKHKIHPADITLADFWGVNKAVKNFNDDKGVSLVLVNNEKGDKWFCEIEDQTECVICKAEQSNQRPLREPFPEPEGRNDFWKLYRHKGFFQIACHYAGVSRKTVVKEQLHYYKNKVLKYF